LLHTLQVLYMCTVCDSTNINTTIEWNEMKCKHTKRLPTAAILVNCAPSGEMHNYCTPHIIKENFENFLIHRCNYIPLSQVYCVWQVVKTPTIISNNPVFPFYFSVIYLRFFLFSSSLVLHSILLFYSILLCLFILFYTYHLLLYVLPLLQSFLSLFLTMVTHMRTQTARSIFPIFPFYFPSYIYFSFFFVQYYLFILSSYFIIFFVVFSFYSSIFIPFSLFFLYLHHSVLCFWLCLHT
jgi:hypothetical protein